MAVKYTYPLLQVDECTNTLGDAVYFTTLDVYSEYWQMKIRLKDLPKTAFVGYDGTVQCARMPFGLTIAPECFERAFDLTLTKY